jgi:hypothetical protein
MSASSHGDGGLVETGTAAGALVEPSISVSDGARQKVSVLESRAPSASACWSGVKKRCTMTSGGRSEATSRRVSKFQSLTVRSGPAVARVRPSNEKASALTVSR